MTPRSEHDRWGRLRRWLRDPWVRENATDVGLAALVAGLAVGVLALCFRRGRGLSA